MDQRRTVDGLWRTARRGLAMLAVIVLAAGVAACGGSGGEGDSAGTSPAGAPPKTPTGTLRAALDAQPATIDPSLAFGSAEMAVATAVYDGLVARDPKHPDELVPALATSWKSNADATEWTFTLRRGVKFSDGAPFDAAAAKRSLEYTQREGSYSYAEDSTFKVVDSHTLVVKCKHPFPEFPRDIRLTMMVSPNLLEGSWKQVEKRILSGKAVGTGPYVLDSFSSAAGFVGHANPDYWGEGPYIEKLELRPIPEESARIAALQAGDVDLVMGATPRAAQSVQDDPRLKVDNARSWVTEGLYLPTQKKPFDDARVRQALAYAIDPPAVVETLLLGQATPLEGLLPQGVYGSQAPETQYSYDAEKAKALLAEAGVKTPVKATMAASAGSSGALAGQALAEQAKAAGFDITFKVVGRDTYVTFFGDPQRKIDILLHQIGNAGGGTGIFNSLSIVANYESEGIRAINTVADGPERLEIVADALEEVATEVPVIPLWQRTGLDLSVKELQNHTPAVDNYMPNWTQHYLEQ